MRPPSLSPKAILFDIDDTLFDRERAQIDVLRHIKAEFCHLFRELRDEAITEAFHESDRAGSLFVEEGAPWEPTRVQRSRVFLRLLGLPEERAEEINEFYISLYPRVHAPMENVHALLATLAQRFALAIVSNGTHDVQTQKLETIGIRAIFSPILLSEEIGIRKPDPRIFLWAARTLGLLPRECLHIGDSYEADVCGAHAAGMLTCWLNRHGAALPPDGPHPDIEVNSLDAIREPLCCPK